MRQSWPCLGPVQSQPCSCPPNRGMEREWKEGREQEREGRERDGIEGMGKKRKEERDGIGEEGGEGEGWDRRSSPVSGL